MTEISPAQTLAVAVLSDPRTHGGAAVSRADTHGGMVFLAGDRAWKLKRDVRFAYMDFSTPQRRFEMLRRELRLNRRTAPEIYLGLAFVGADGTLGPVAETPPDRLPEGAEPVLAMRRFDQATLFDRLATAGRLTPALMTGLAEHIAGFHAAADRRRGDDGAAQLSRVVGGTLDEVARWPAVLDADAVARVTRETRAALDAGADLLDRRARDGFRIEGHGDLHLRNICLWPDAEAGAPTLFDALEFSEEIATVDVYYDLAFLLMDLAHRDLGGLANTVLNRYVELTGDVGLDAMPLFLSSRAQIRAHVSAATAEVAEGVDAADTLRREARGYLDLALDLLAPPPPRLVALGGVSGTGKSSVARALAPGLGACPGAVILRSDGIRKALFGAAETSRLPADAYAPEVSARVYETLIERTRGLLGAGRAVIADATFLLPEGRARMEAAATEVGAPFHGLWLEAPAEVLESRVAARRGDASDADVRVLRDQLAGDPGPLRWPRLDAARAPDAVAASARAALDA